MAGPDDELDIFDSATVDDSAPASGSPQGDSEALTNAITNLHRQGGRQQPAAYRSTEPAPAPAPPDAPAHGVTDQSPQGLLRAMLDERDRRQVAEREREEARAEVRRWQEEQQRQRKAAEQPFSQLLFERPDEAVDARLQERLTPLEQRMQTMAVDFDFRLTKQQHGEEAFDAAFQDWYSLVGNPQQPNPALYFAITNAPSPGAALMAWHSDMRVRSEVGNDPAAYRAKIEAEIKAQYGISDDGFASRPIDRSPRQSNGQFAPRQEVRLPTATSRLGRAASGVSPIGEDDGSEEAIFDAGRSRRR